MFYLTRMLGKPVVDATGEAIGDHQRHRHRHAARSSRASPRSRSSAPTRRRSCCRGASSSTTLDDERVELNVSARRAALQLPAARRGAARPRPAQQADRRHAGHEGRARQRPQALRVAATSCACSAPRSASAASCAASHPRSSAPRRAVARLFGRELPENLIAWNYMDLLDRDLSHVQLSVTHKRLHELHPADVADILEQLVRHAAREGLRAPRQRPGGRGDLRARGRVPGRRHRRPRRPARVRHPRDDGPGRRRRHHRRPALRQGRGAAAPDGRARSRAPSASSSATGRRRPAAS